MLAIFPFFFFFFFFFWIAGYVTLLSSIKFATVWCWQYWSSFQQKLFLFFIEKYRKVKTGPDINKFWQNLRQKKWSLGRFRQFRKWIPDVSYEFRLFSNIFLITPSRRKKWSFFGGVCVCGGGAKKMRAVNVILHPTYFSWFMSIYVRTRRRRKIVINGDSGYYVIRSLQLWREKPNRFAENRWHLSWKYDRSFFFLEMAHKALECRNERIAGNGVEISGDRFSVSSFPVEEI